MEFKYYKNDRLPMLSWCGVIKRNTNYTHIYHGSNIYTNSDFFVEGAWDGEFINGEFDKAEFFLGSGGKRLNHDGDKILFVTTSHTLERLYSRVKNDITFISNSLPFILLMSEGELDETYLNYESDFRSILEGLSSYKKNIRLKDNNTIKLHYYTNLLLNESFELVEMPKEKIKPFISYNNYEERLISTVKSFVDNANSPLRKIHYNLITTISKGYDSAASAAIAHEAGCDKVVLLNGPEKYLDDYGDDTATRLGYKQLVSKDGNAFLSNESYLEAEFVSAGELGTGIVFTAFENEFKNSIVFMGDRGDKIWDKNKTDINNEFRFEGEVFAETSLIENRLKNGFIVFPLPLYGASQWESIHKISNSPEMSAYSVGGNYDRPIPRRILETRNVDREMFGMKKAGAGFTYRFDTPKRLKRRMSPHSFEAFYSFYKRNKSKRKNPWFAKNRYIWSNKYTFSQYILTRIGFKNLSMAPNPNNLTNPGIPSYLFNWGIDEMIKRYTKANIDKWWKEPINQ